MTSLDSSTAGLSSLEGKYDCVVVKSTLQTPVERTSDEEIAQNDNSIKYNDNYNSPLFKLHPILTTITPTAVGIETNLKPTENSLTECVDISTQQGNSLFLLNEQERGDKPTFVAPNISCMPPTTNGNFFPSALLPSPCYDLSNDMSLTSRSTECCDESVNSAESNNTSTNDDININNNNINNNTNNIPQVNELKNPSTTQAVSIEVLSEVPLERQPPHGSLVILALENSTDPKTLPLQEKPADTENSVSTENPTEDPSTPQKSKRQIIIGYILLVVALFAVSSLGAATLLMKDVKPVLAGAWRLQCSTLFLIPSFIWQIKSATKEDWKKWLKWKNLKYMAGVWLGMYLFSATFFVALAFTSLAHAYLFNNLQSIIIVVGKLVLRQPVMKPEIFGAVLAIFGVSLSLVEVDGGNGESHLTTDIVIGDIIALVGSFGAVIYLLWAKKLRRQIPLFIYILPINILNATSTLILSVIMESTRASESTSLSSHAFGWFSSEYILGTLYLGIVTGVFGMVCYAALLNLLSPLVISVVMLLEPALGTVLGIAVGVSHVPDTWTIVGGVLTLIGTLVVTGVNGAKALKNASKPKKSVSKKSVKEVVVVGVEDKSYPA